MTRKSTWTVCTAALVSMGTAVHGRAQDQQPIQGAQAAQTQMAAPTAVIVTGSRIARRDADGVGPMLTLTQEDVKFAARPLSAICCRVCRTWEPALIQTAHKERRSASARSICATLAVRKAAETALWCWSTAIAGSMLPADEVSAILLTSTRFRLVSSTISKSSKTAHRQSTALMPSPAW